MRSKTLSVFSSTWIVICIVSLWFVIPQKAQADYDPIWCNSLAVSEVKESGKLISPGPDGRYYVSPGATISVIYKFTWPEDYNPWDYDYKWEVDDDNITGEMKDKVTNMQTNNYPQFSYTTYTFDLPSTNYTASSIRRSNLVTRLFGGTECVKRVRVEFQTRPSNIYIGAKLPASWPYGYPNYTIDPGYTDATYQTQRVTSDVIPLQGYFLHSIRPHGAGTTYTLNSLHFSDGYTVTSRVDGVITSNGASVNLKPGQTLYWTIYPPDTDISATIDTKRNGVSVSSITLGQSVDVEWGSTNATNGCTVEVGKEIITPPDTRYYDYKFFANGIEGGQPHQPSETGMYQYRNTCSNDFKSAVAAKTLTVSTASQPDLTAGAISPTTVRVNTGVRFSSTISNIDNAPTGSGFSVLFQTATGYNASTDVATGVSTIGVTTVSAVATGGSVTATAPEDEFSSIGTRYVRACADKSSPTNTGIISESNETNNCGPWTAVSVVSGPIATLNVNGVGASNVAISCTNGMSGTTNYTKTSSSNISTTCTAPNPAYSGGPVFTGWTDDCSTSSSTCTISVSTGETREITANYASRPDLIAGPITPTTTLVNVTTIYSGTITNIGTVGTGVSFPYNFQIRTTSDDSTIENRGGTTPALGAGGSVTVNIPYAFTSTYPAAAIRLCADLNQSMSGSVVPESNEGNNCGDWTPIAITSPESATLSCTPSSVTGQSATYTVTTGGRYTGTMSVTASPQSSSIIANLGDSTLTSGQSTTMEVFPVQGTPPGSYTITVNGSVSGLRPSCTVGFVLPAADLIAGNPAPTSVLVNTPVSFSSLISNVGNYSTQSGFAVRFQESLSSSGSSPTTIATVNTSTLSNVTGNNTRTVTATPSRTYSAVGTRYIQVCADSGSAITELREDNNCSGWIKVTISSNPQPDLTAGAVSPTSVPANQATPISATISNTGNASTVSGFTNLFQISNQPNGANIIDQKTSSRAFLSASASGPVSYTYPFTNAGTWSVRVCADKTLNMADPNPQIIESNEGNNCGAWTDINVTSPAVATLNVNSSGATGVSITGSPSAYSGVTNYTRTSPTTISTTLTPGTSGSLTFNGWSGCNSTNNNSCIVSVDTGQVKTVIANYEASGVGSFDYSLSHSGNVIITKGGSSASAPQSEDNKLTLTLFGQSYSLPFSMTRMEATALHSLESLQNIFRGRSGEPVELMEE